MRYFSGKDMQKFREKQKEDEMREAAEKLRKEREEDKKHKELVRQQIARHRSDLITL